ncbi:hypothetical protein SPD48_16845 [Pseudogracilibacillus sp. SE30717A]|uniref:hypothetical protein n=1 Tax=Pseudogracilibacillus sp. SE30717A TaxID=3098293 RepID=UPI00300DBF48
MFIKVLLWMVLILPWLSLFFMKKSDIKRYMPVTILTALLTTILFEIAYTYGWWTLHIDIMPWGYITNTSFTYGGYAIATLWIFYFTSHNFWLFMLTELIVNAFWAFIGLHWIIDKFMGVATFQIKNWQWFLIEIVVVLILYAYHHWQRKIFVPSGDTNE